jgi:uncharacterized protein (TIGR03435 family)
MTGIEQVRLMLRRLTADRFKLTVHNEMMRPVYNLVIARQHGRLGPQLRKSTSIARTRGPLLLPRDARGGTTRFDVDS